METLMILAWLSKAQTFVIIGLLVIAACLYIWIQSYLKQRADDAFIMINTRLQNKSMIELIYADFERISARRIRKFAIKKIKLDAMRSYLLETINSADSFDRIFHKLEWTEYLNENQKKAIRTLMISYIKSIFTVDQLASIYTKCVLEEIKKIDDYSNDKKIILDVIDDKDYFCHGQDEFIQSGLNFFSQLEATPLSDLEIILLIAEKNKFSKLFD